MTDSVLGAWNYSYDHLNRVSSAVNTNCAPSGTMTLSWNIDPFGNRLSQTASATGSCSASATQPNLSVNANNQIVGFTYDADGRVTNDGRNTYVYDAEGRVVSINNGATTYRYDAEGRRVAKLSGGSISSSYLLGLDGEQVTELNGSGGWVHSNVFAGGKLIATYAGPNDTDSAVSLAKIPSARRNGVP